MDGAVKIIEEVAPRIEDRGLVLVLVELIIDVLKLHRFAVIVICHPADAVREHFKIGNCSLCGEFIGAFGPCDGGGDLLSLCAGQLAFEG